MTAAALASYRALLRAGRAYPDYNVRNYILRRARDAFREHRGAAGPQAAALLSEVGARRGRTARARDRSRPARAARVPPLPRRCSQHASPPSPPARLLQAAAALALVHRQGAIAGFYAGPEPSVMESFEARRAAAASAAR